MIGRSDSPAEEVASWREAGLEALGKGRISWYVMASPATVGQVREAFETSGNFGMEEDQVKIFCQGTLPCLSEEGDILLKDRSILATNPDGNGGLYKALKEENILDDMKRKGIKHILLKDRSILATNPDG